MARNQPFDFSDDDDIGITSRSSSSDLLGASGDASMAGRSDMSDADLLGDAAGQQAGRAGGKGAQEAQKSAQQTQTASRSSTGQHDTPTSMRHKRGNQPR